MPHQGHAIAEAKWRAPLLERLGHFPRSSHGDSQWRCCGRGFESRDEELPGEDSREGRSGASGPACTNVLGEMWDPRCTICGGEIYNKLLVGGYWDDCDDSDHLSQFSTLLFLGAMRKSYPAVPSKKPQPSNDDPNSRFSSALLSEFQSLCPLAQHSGNSDTFGRRENVASRGAGGWALLTHRSVCSLVPVG